MQALDLSRCPITPAAHQVIGVERIVAHPYFFLADGMGAGKTKQTIDAAQVLFERNVIDTVVVLCPTYVREVWFDPELGELKKHLWADLPAVVHEVHQRTKTWTHGPDTPRKLQWLITNYEFMRVPDRRQAMLEHCTGRTMLVLDESSYIRTHDAKQTKAAHELRAKCGRVLLLNGTPVSERPMDAYAQANVMHRSIFECKTYYHFRARYAVMGGWNQKQIISYRNLDDMTRRLAPYILMRRTRDCFDLPEALPTVTHSVALDANEWRVYKEMRDEMVAWLESGVSATQHAMTKVMRLAQITSGFLGGVETEDGREQASEVTIIGSSKVDFLAAWHAEQLEQDTNLKLLVWTRFLPELRRVVANAAKISGNALGVICGQPILGGRVEDERSWAKRLLHPETAPEGPVTVCGTYGTGAFGINLTACHTYVNLSIDYNNSKAQQSAARVDRPGQRHPVSSFDVVATGPQGQKTIDHAIAKAVRTKHDVAEMTTRDWIYALKE